VNARADARAKIQAEAVGRAADAPIVDDAGPYEFAPEDVRAEYERVYEETIGALRRSR
jgi:hypothetical protein